MTNTLSRIEKAYGGCKLCYGKGYSTVRYGWAEGNEVVEAHKTHIHYCSCDRGKQLKENILALIEELEAGLPKDKLVIIQHEIKEDLTTQEGIMKDATERITKMTAERWATYYYNLAIKDVKTILDNYKKEITS